jgi:hypothetical protein
VAASTVGVCCRFDIVLLLLDQHEPQWDSIVSEHVLANHQQVSQRHRGLDTDGNACTPMDAPRTSVSMPGLHLRTTRLWHALSAHRAHNLHW